VVSAWNCIRGNSGIGGIGLRQKYLSRSILQLIRPTAGKLSFKDKFNRSVAAKPAAANKMVKTPHACLNPLMTVGQSIADPLFIHQLATPTEARKLANAGAVGLTPQLSIISATQLICLGGQQQRSDRSCLDYPPKLLICDEPVSMLDASVQTQVLELMLELKRELI